MRTPDYSLPDSNQAAEVDAWFTEELIPDYPALQLTLEKNAEQGLPAHDVSALQGKMLAIFVQMVRATRVLEIGTLGGYSTLWMAKALPSHGCVTTIEFNQHHSEIARQNIADSGLSERVEQHTGAALDILPTLTGPFDLIFVDADKANNPRYLEWALKLSRPGTVIVGDNTVRGGRVIHSSSDDPHVQSLREFIRMISENPQLEATAIQTVGEKGWDGFVLAIVKAA